MKKTVALGIAMVSEDLLHRLLGALKGSGDQPLMVKEVAAKISTSPNTAGKYVDVAESRGWIRTDYYSTARRVFLTSKGEAELARQAAK